MEQTSNAAALQKLGYGQMMHKINAAVVEQWLYETKAVRVIYPNTARYLVEWIKNGMPPVEQSWCNRIWAEVKVTPVELTGESGGPA